VVGWVIDEGFRTSLRYPTEIGVVETIAFLQDVLPEPPARVLDVGCGRGDITRALAGKGFAVLGIDSDREAAGAAAGEGLPVIEGDFLAFEGDAFDVVLFGRSLHHISPLADALEHARRLVADGGVVVAEEFSVESMDAHTATWFYDLDSILQTVGLLRPDSEARPSIHDRMERWRAEHDFDPPLNTGAQMTEELSRTFEVERLDRVAYLYRDFCARLPSDQLGVRAGRRLMELEANGIGAKALAPVGLRVVARPR
jgi:SAM-dependent methyltransferase